MTPKEKETNKELIIKANTLKQDDVIEFKTLLKQKNKRVMKAGYKVENITTHLNPDCICLYNLIFYNEVTNVKTRYSTISKTNNTVGVWKIKQLKTNN